MKTPKSGTPSFEKALERLESIVEKLESEELGLDASLTLFEEGIGLSRLCQAKLEEVEKRVEIVLRESGGEYRAVAYAEVEVAAAEGGEKEGITGQGEDE